MEICNESLCSGCSVCMNICPRSAITMQENLVAELHPVIDQKKCVHCGLCQKCCPQNYSCEKKEVLHCYAAFASETENRVESASGGIGALLHRVQLAKENAVCYSVRWDKDFRAVYCRNTDSSKIDEFRGSKYVQSELRDIPKNIEMDLKKNLSVLYLGLPCHVAGLQNYLYLHHVDQENLVTVELLCHGVAPVSYLQQELSMICNSKKIETIHNITFRGNKKFRSFHFCVDGVTNRGKRYCYNRYCDTDYYFRGYLQDGTTLRESCYHCQYASLNRNADIAIGDFIDLGKNPRFAPYESDHKNVSVVLCYTQKGEALYNAVKPYLNSTERTVAEAFESCPALRGPYRKGIYREDFLKRYRETGDFIRSAQFAYGDKIRQSRRTLFAKEMIINVLTNVLRKY